MTWPCLQKDEWYAWFSQQNSDKMGTAFYETPGGEELEISVATRDKTYPFIRETDGVYLGVVKTFLRKGCVGYEMEATLNAIRKQRHKEKEKSSSAVNK